MNLQSIKRIGLIIVLLIFSITAILAAIYDLNYSEIVATAGLFFAIAAFSVVLYTLYATYIQLKKSMAKPMIEVAFNKSGEQQINLTHKDGQFKTGLPHPCLINKGNAVARYFQIDFIIPENIGKPSAFVPLSKDNGNYILSYINEGRYTLFVNRPHSDPNTIFSAAFDLSKCIELNIASFTIKYKVYGDWAETQEGELKVNINKQEETN